MAATDSISRKRTLRSLSQGHVQGHAPALWAPGWCPFCLVGSSGCSGDSMSFGGTISCYVFCPHDGGAVWGEPHIPKSNEWTFPHPRAPRTGLSQQGAEILTEERVSGAHGAGGGRLSGPGDTWIVAAPLLLLHLREHPSKEQNEPSASSRLNTADPVRIRPAGWPPRVRVLCEASEKGQWTYTSHLREQHTLRPFLP